MLVSTFWKMLSIFWCSFLFSIVMFGGNEEYHLCALSIAGFSNNQMNGELVCQAL
jgi:hypothetical protein